MQKRKFPLFHKLSIEKSPKEGHSWYHRGDKGQGDRGLTPVSLPLVSLAPVVENAGKEEMQ